MNKINMEGQGKCKHCNLYRFCPTFQYRNRFNDIRNQVVVTNHNQLVQSVLNSLSGRTPISLSNIKPNAADQDLFDVPTPLSFCRSIR